MCVLALPLIRDTINNVYSTIGEIASDILDLLPVKVLSSLIVRETIEVLRNGIPSAKCEEQSFGISLMAQPDDNTNSISLIELIKYRYQTTPNLTSNSLQRSLGLPIPNSLYVHIDRWQYFLTSETQPIGRQVFLPMSMDCQHFFPNFNLPSGKVEYSLVGFIRHFGAMFSGCFDVFVKSTSSRLSDWLYFQDNRCKFIFSFVSNCSASTVLEYSAVAGKIAEEASSVVMACYNLELEWSTATHRFFPEKFRSVVGVLLHAARLGRAPLDFWFCVLELCSPDWF